jgi:hypothetical protein
MTEAAGELLPCPWCGSTPVKAGYSYRCDGCGAYGPEAPFKNKAKDAWNTRATPAEAGSVGTPEGVHPDLPTLQERGQ